MRKISILVLAFVLLANNAFGSPLIFTISKDVLTDDLTEIATIDTAKYRQIRIGITSELKGIQKVTPEMVELIVRQSEMTSELIDLRLTLKENHPSVKAKQAELGKVNGEIEEAAKAQKSGSLSEFLGVVSVMGIEGENLIKIDKVILSSADSSASVMLDSPPTKLKIYAKGSGKFTVYIWGQ